jgi:hypothetical protein
MGRGTEFYLGLGALLFAAAALALAIVEPFAEKDDAETRPTFVLKAAATDGRIRVDWDPRNPSVRSAERATLEVQDGGALERYPVDKNTLSNGGLDYLQKSRDVLLTLWLHHDGQPDLAATVRTIGAIEPPPPPPAPSAPTPTRRPASRARRR